MKATSFHTAILLLGGNAGNRLHYMIKAFESIQLRCGSSVACSNVYETASWGMEGLPPHLNMAVKLMTSLSPMELLEEIQSIENSLERQRSEKWGERTIDIDILYFDDLVIRSQQLTIPHPYLQARRFALVPLCDIAQAQIHPVLNKSNRELLDDCEDKLPVSFYQEAFIS